MPPLIAVGIAITALGLLAMVVSLMLPVPSISRFGTRLFDVGFAVFTLALTYWLIVAAAAFFTASRFHAV